MTIPRLENRLLAIKEICRILKTGGKFIFTTHDINNPNFLEYWKEEKIKWEKGVHDKNLYRYGDAISFVHVPQNGEVDECFDKSGLKLLFKAL